VPSANLIPLFLQERARRFIFEGRECGGHIGPLSSFVLWSAMVDRLTAELAKGTVPGSEIELLFAGGIHDAASSAMVQVLVAPLVARGVKVGILMGSAYLFTEEIVASGAIVPQFQQEVIDCERTVNLESGPGHASRCAYTPFAKDFFRMRIAHRENGVPADESRAILDDLILGRLRIASKGRTRRGLNAELESLSASAQRAEGMYMLGQVATLRSQVTRIEAPAPRGQRRRGGAAAKPARRVETPALAPTRRPTSRSSASPASCRRRTRPASTGRTSSTRSTRSPRSRRTAGTGGLYFDADRTAKDKIYSKWGGFLDDMAFDPMRYGMPPKSITSVDPMQLMALEVARQTIEDAGYHEKAFDRERASVIVGASGGTGDVGSQYGLRSELPRFSGALRRKWPSGCPSGPRIPSPASCSTSSPGGSPTGSTSAASTSPPTRPAPRRWRRSTRASPSWWPGAATSSSPAASTRCRGRSATSASARPRRCRRAAAARPSTPRATASSSPKASPWWRSSASPMPSATATGSMP
jgi:hypothetical protein